MSEKYYANKIIILNYWPSSSNQCIFSSYVFGYHAGLFISVTCSANQHLVTASSSMIHRFLKSQSQIAENSVSPESYFLSALAKRNEGSGLEIGFSFVVHSRTQTLLRAKMKKSGYEIKRDDWGLVSPYLMKPNHFKSFSFFSSISHLAASGWSPI